MITKPSSPWWGARNLGPIAVSWHYEIPTWWNAGLRHEPTGIGIELSADAAGLEVRFCWKHANRDPSRGS